MKCPSCKVEVLMPVKVCTSDGDGFVVPGGMNTAQFGSDGVMRCPHCAFTAHIDYWMARDGVPNNPYQNVPLVPKSHWLKIDRKFFYDILTGAKTFEIQKNDRGFKVGHCLILQVWENGEHTKQTLPVQVHYITDFPDGLRPGYIVMGIKRI